MVGTVGGAVRVGLRRWGYAALLGGAVAWLAALVAAPMVVSRLPAEHAAVRAATAVYLAGAVVCHQRADRSFHADGVRVPVCGRCLGLYVGAVAGLVVAGLCSRRRAVGVVDRLNAGWGWRAVLAVAAAPAGASWLLESVGALPPEVATPVRAATGIGLGAIGAWAIGLAWRAWSVTGR